MRVPQAVRDLARRLDAGWGGSLRGDPAAVPLLAAILARATGRRLILVAAGSSRVEALRAELEVLMPGVVSGLRPLLASPYVVAQGDRVSEAGRVGTLARFLQEPGAARVLVVGAWEWMRRQPPPWFLDRRSLLVGAGEVLDRTALVEGTVALGYGRVDQVEDPGQIAVRGGLIDVFPAGAPWPVRIDLFGDRVDSLSSFDPATQALGEGLDLCVIPPARLVPLEGDFLVRLREALRVLGDELRYPSRLMGDLLRSLTEGQRPPELEVLYPLAVPLDGTVRDFGEDAVVLFDDLAEVRKRMGMIWEQEAERHRLARAAGALVLPPERLYRPAGEAGSTEGLPRWLDLGPLASDGVDAGIEPLFFAADGVQGRSALFAAEARRWLEDGLEVVLLGEDGEVLERTRRILGSHGLGAVVHLEPWSVEWLQGLPGGTRVHLAAGSVSRGFLAREFGLIVAGEADLFGRRAEPPQPARRRVSDAVRVLSSLEEGDLVVHPRYGIGRFLGLETKAAGGVEASFLCLEYAGRDRLYVPVHHADRIQRYVGSEERTAALDRLGGVVWEKRKARAREAAKKLAFDLVQVYAKRQALPGHAFAAG
ncbi:MAG: hypothetical protein FJ098_13670, partial [Deltaproteobacteria bacterium]|nr:hypothetical protein [Deltaproteobacteria bacterium]